MTDVSPHLIFRVADKGNGLPDGVLRQVEHTSYTQIYRLPEIHGGIRGSGLRRVFGLGNLNNRRVSYSKIGGAVFEVDIGKSFD